MGKGWKIFWIICGVTALAGLVCCAAAWGMGVTLGMLHDRFPHGIGWYEEYEESGPVAENIHESFQGITEIDAELFAGDVSVVRTDGDEVRVDTDHLSQKLGFRCYTEGSELKIRTDKKLFHINHVGIGTITISIPKKMKLEEASFDMGAGTLYIEDIYAADFSVNVGAGEVDIDCFGADEAELECGAGTIRAKGDIRSEIDITCGVGEIQYTASGHEKEYNYEIECSVGEVVCGGHDYSGIGGERKIDNNADKKIDISTGVGAVTVDFDGLGTHHME